MNNQNVKILVIEDDEYSRDALAHLLVAEGYQAQSASDGETGLEKAHEVQPDVIVLDLNLPGIDGKEVIEKIRGDGPLRSVPILVITGDEASAGQAAVDLGADGYLTKPVEFDDLINAISGMKSKPVGAA
ncbi:MAG: response regulator transcription factor [Blastocatellia bacterium]|jgi:CheY-like chemotaxis protein